MCFVGSNAAPWCFHVRVIIRVWFGSRRKLILKFYLKKLNSTFFKKSWLKESRLRRLSETWHLPEKWRLAEKTINFLVCPFLLFFRQRVKNRVFRERMVRVVVKCRLKFGISLEKIFFDRLFQRDTCIFFVNGRKIEKCDCLVCKFFFKVGNFFSRKNTLMFQRGEHNSIPACFVRLL